MNVDEFKKVRKHLRHQEKQDNTLSIKKFFFRFFNQILLTTIIFLITLIVIKIDKDYKSAIYNAVYQKNLNFASTNEFYQKYIGSILPLGSLNKKQIPVFQENLVYQEDNLYKNGGVLTVSENYMVPVLESGIIVFIGEKEDYGKTVIVQQVNGIDVWYGNINIDNLKMYDYVEKGNLLGETLSNQLYLAFQKEGKFLDYKENIT